VAEDPDQRLEKDQIKKVEDEKGKREKLIHISTHCYNNGEKRKVIRKTRKTKLMSWKR